ncbi:MAG TPA: hypothetical protein VFB72_06040, partial [Verrucomicrobiae bacterium]|nr:hypothetical protein [Verrucomicrobiae bacterium]
MGASRSNSGLKWVCLVLGILLFIGALGYLAWNGYLVWNAWKAPVHAVKGKPVVHPQLVSLLSAYAGKLMGGIIGFFAGIWLLQFASKQADSSLVAEAEASQSQGLAVVPELAVKAHKPGKARRWTSANILAVGAGARRLWNFSSGKNGFMVAQQASVPVGQPLPAKLVARDWRNLSFLQPKLNVAWLPVEEVFLRVAHLPVSNFDETLSMVELQLEKLSPLPVTQVVWTVHILPQVVDNLQTIII